MNRTIDLRSDVKSTPTERMRAAMMTAELGDNVAGADPTVNELERQAADLFGKEACLFNPSGTMSNLLAVITHARPGQEVVVEEASHICMLEGGGLAYVGGLMAHPVLAPNGIFSPDDVLEAIRPRGLSYSSTGVICFENTHCVYGGKALTPQQMHAAHEVARNRGIPVHTDGERIWNAAIAQRLDVKEFARSTDSLTVGLSKGLCCPAGSLLVGTQAFVQQARKTQKMLGGMMRKPGVLAAAALIAISENVERLAEDHENARVLAQGLEGLPGLLVDVQGVQTNIVNVDISSFPLSPDEFIDQLKTRGVLAAYHLFKPTLVRLVTYKDLRREDILRAIEVTKEVVRVGARVRGGPGSAG